MEKNDIFRQIEELTLENEKLRKENTRLRAENRDWRAENIRLRERIETLKTSIEDSIAKAVSEAVANATDPLYKKIEKQKQEIDRLKAQLKKD